MADCTAEEAAVAASYISLLATCVQKIVAEIQYASDLSLLMACQASCLPMMEAGAAIPKNRTGLEPFYQLLNDACLRLDDRLKALVLENETLPVPDAEELRFEIDMLSNAVHEHVTGMKSIHKIFLK